MDLKNLTAEDHSLVGACLNSAANGPFFPDWEFQTLFGVEPAVVRNVAVQWPKVDPSDEDVELAVVNSLNNLLGYPHGYPDSEIGHSAPAIRAALDKLLPTLPPREPTF